MDASRPTNTRRSRRFQIDSAYIDIEYPEGFNWHLRLLNVSFHGVCFQRIDGIEGVAPGDVLTAVLGIDGREVPGQIVVVRVDPAMSESVCGAEFCPRGVGARDCLAHLMRSHEAQLATPVPSPP